MKKKLKINLCSFASPDLKRSAIRLIKQAKNIDLYKKVKVYSFDDLTNVEKKTLKKLLNEGKKRGYGYWFWKPIIIKRFLLSLKKNEILNYVDVGSHLNLNGYSRLKTYINLVKNSKNGVLAFQYNKLKKKNSFILKDMNICILKVIY